MEIREWFAEVEPGAVLADSPGGFVRLWAVLPLTGSTGRAVRRFFPGAQPLGGTAVVRLGGWPSFAAAVDTLAEAKMTSTSPTVQALHLMEGRDGVGMRTIPTRLIVGS